MKYEGIIFDMDTREFLKALIRGGKLKGTKRWLAILFLLGSAFIPVQYLPFFELLKEALGSDPLQTAGLFAAGWAGVDQLQDIVAKKKA